MDLDELSEDTKLLREEVHRFAVEVIRPASIELDRMPPEERVKPGSPYFKVIAQMKKLGYHRIMIPPEKGGVELTPLQRYVIMEELGWGSLGLATAIGVDMIPFACAALYGSEEVFEELVKPWLEDTKGKFHGCWGVTEPEHGSDYLPEGGEGPRCEVREGKRRCGEGRGRVGHTRPEVRVGLFGSGRDALRTARAACWR